MLFPYLVHPPVFRHRPPLECPAILVLWGRSVRPLRLIMWESSDLEAATKPPPLPRNPKHIPGQKCQVCTHPQRAEIEALIISAADNPDVTIRGIAVTYSVVESAIHRHKASHLPYDLALALRASRSPAPAAHLEELAGIAIAGKVARLKKLDAVVAGLEKVIEARRTAHAEAPGGETGLVITKKRALGSGPLQQIIDEYEVDTGLIGEMRALLAQAADETTDRTRGGAGKQHMAVMALPVANSRIVIEPVRQEPVHSSPEPETPSGPTVEISISTD